MTIPAPLPRRSLLAAAGVAALGVAGGARAAARRVRFTPLPGAGDAPYWVARAQGYFGDVGTALAPGPADAADGAKLVDRRQADLGAIAPERFALRLQQGLPLVSVWQIDEADPFALAFRKGEAPAALKALSGKTVLLDAAARRPFCDVWFAQAGLEPGAVAYREAGPGWGEALARGRGDAALAWEGQRALWRGQNLGFDYLPGRAVSRLPGACFVARAADLAADLADDLADAGRRAPLQAALRGWAMGVTFAARNPRAAAHLLSQSAPGLAERMPPPVATDAVMRCVAAARADGAVAGGLGRHDADRWALLFATMRKIGQIAAPLAASAAVSNDLIAGANAFDADAVRSDADRYALPPEFAAVDVDALRAAP